MPWAWAKYGEKLIKANNQHFSWGKSIQNKLDTVCTCRPIYKWQAVTIVNQACPSQLHGFQNTGAVRLVYALSGNS